jgi:hypothetical protein
MVMIFMFLMLVIAPFEIAEAAPNQEVKDQRKSLAKLLPKAEKLIRASEAKTAGFSASSLLLRDAKLAEARAAAASARAARLVIQNQKETLLSADRANRANPETPHF